MKTAFYFRTQEEFEKVWNAVASANSDARKEFNFRSKIIYVKSRYLGDPKSDRNPVHIVPRTVPTGKKYIGVIKGNKHQIERAGIDPVAIVEKLGLDRVQHSDNEPNYKGELSTAKTHLKSHTQLKMLVSMFDERFGSGNWGIHGPKRLNKKLNEMEKSGDRTWGEGANLNKRYPNGIPVKVVVKQEGVDVKKYIFKLALMI